MASPAPATRPTAARFAALSAALCTALLAFPAAAAPAPGLEAELRTYQETLERLRSGRPGMRYLPDGRFFLFGMGPRRKLVYQAGALKDARTGEALRRWKVSRELIVPSAYTVALTTSMGPVQIAEDEEGIFLVERGKRTALATGKVALPKFDGHPFGPVLRVLHQEILVNIVDGKPLPNFFVYAKPWYRDGAMMAMVLQKTGNTALLTDWIRGISDPFDRNNAGEEEADNPGQVLYLLSLLGDKSHPAIDKATAALGRFHEKDYVKGRSDFAFRPVYQTKWAKFGLRALGLPDPYNVPKVDDGYWSLFWWDYKDSKAKGARFGIGSALHYPYLVWAEDNYVGAKNGPVGNRDYPLTWEAHASQARYEGMAPLGRAYVEQKISAPHTWHAAEMFLLLEANR